MNPTPPIDITTPSRSRRRGRKGRLWIAAIWLALRGADALWLWLAAPLAELGRHDKFYAINSAVISTILIVCMWQRQNWARYLHLLLLGYVLIGAGIALTAIMPARSDGDLGARLLPFAGLIAASAIYLAAAVALIRLRAVRRLVERTTDLSGRS